MVLKIDQFAAWVPLACGVVIPFVVAYVTRSKASPTQKAAVSAVAAAATALGMYITGAGVHTWVGGASAFVVALIAASSSRVALTGHLVDAVQASATGFIGPNEWRVRALDAEAKLAPSVTPEAAPVAPA